ncbi:MAG: helix-turn-helix domain-containing protein [Magnetococcales bacterium]|nr:helix-turn-helix domain-containing protein [Magnetococcales bacterium]
METRHINPFQLARRWGINPRTLQNWRCKDKGPAYLKIGGHIMYRENDIEQYEAEHHVHTNNTSKRNRQEERT